MKFSYVIDGYNLLHAMGVLAGRLANPQGLEKARGKLLADLAEAFAVEASLLTVVFDGSAAPRRSDAEQFIHGIHVLFAQGGKEADDLIENLIAEHPHPKHLAVVSDDHRLQRAARRRQAQDMSCSTFLDVVDHCRKKTDGAQPPTESAEDVKNPQLSPAETQHWLAEFGHLQQDIDRHDLPVPLVKLPPARPGKIKKPTKES
jgi:predicted RNA-binding protein with PIN domain